MAYSLSETDRENTQTSSRNLEGGEPTGEVEFKLDMPCP